ncbi:MAG: transglutaminase-like domain-containing protein [Microgenomates group bacterium]
MFKIWSAILFSFALIFFAISAPVSAQESDQFETTLDSEYTVDKLGITRVKHQFTITNTSPTIFLKQYGMKSSYPSLQNVTVTYNNKPLEATVVSGDSGTSIGITFPDELVGQGKSRKFTIEYTNRDIATIGGIVLEVHIPKLSDQQKITKHSTKIITPKQFGGPVRITPTPTNEESQGETLITQFDDLGGKSISALYGANQIFNMTLRYHLENSGGTPAIAQIALPPDTSYQKMHYHSLEPYTNDLKIDADGNWIATYTIPPHSTTVVQLAADALISLDPQSDVLQIPPSTRLTDSQEYWESQHPVIRELATTYTTPEQIYAYVTSTLNYAHTNVGNGAKRMGALAAITQPDQAVCQEFTDVFISISRAANIPARRAVGYAYTQNDTFRPVSFEGDILHSWPEYYDTASQLWIPVDPTWGNTTGGIDYFSQFDLNHIVFIINGVSSTAPHPAGAYKADGEETKDVEVTFSSSFPTKQPKFAVELDPYKILGVAIPGQYRAQITNHGGQAWYDIGIQITAAEESIPSTATVIDYILPYQTKSISLPITANSWDIFTNQRISVTLTDRSSYEELYTQEYIVRTRPDFIDPISQREIYIGLGVGSTVALLATGSVLVLRQQRERTLRRESKKSKESNKILHPDKTAQP